MGLAIMSHVKKVYGEKNVKWVTRDRLRPVKVNVDGALSGKPANKNSGYY